MKSSHNNNITKRPELEEEVNSLLQKKAVEEILPEFGNITQEYFFFQK